jgi:hypothetical protein
VKCTIEMGSGGMIYLPSFMKIGTGIEVMSCLSQFKSCNFGITDRRDLRCTPLKWVQVA